MKALKAMFFFSDLAVGNIPAHRYRFCFEQVAYIFQTKLSLLNNIVD